MKPLKNCWGAVRPYTRHNTGCKHRRKRDYNDCACPKWLYLHARSGQRSRRSLNTPSWAEAMEIATATLRSLDPEIKAARRTLARQAVSIEEAVATYCADLVARCGETGSVKNARALLGTVDPETKAVKRNGRLFEWLATLPPEQRPHYVADLSPTHLTAWRGAWRYGSDLTAQQRWMVLRGFLHFCEGQGWITVSPARKLKPLKATKGSRTAILSDAQYQAVLTTIPRYQPDKSLPLPTRHSWQGRVTAFMELMRWSGMAMVDAVQYRPEMVDAAGVLRYRRQKTGVLATVPLPAHVLARLRDIPAERDSLGPGQPFRTHGVDLQSDTRTWQRRLTAVFRQAGLTEVRTEVGRVRKVHPHMLRDTFAVWHLRHGTSLHTVSRMLGHANTVTTQRAYLPWVQELEAATIAEARKALVHATRPGRAKVISIGGKSRERGSA